MKMVIENAKKWGDEGLHINENIIDIPAMFDGLWNSHGWTARRGIVSANPENTSQVLDVGVYKTRLCSQCF